MIYKRIYAKLRAQDWAAIAIELAIVIVGVFIGVEAANWNDEREDRARAASYLGRIHDDLETDVSEYRDREKLWAEVRAYGGVGLEFAETGSTVGRTQWQVLLAFFQASQVGEFRPASATYDELRSAGELGLIRDLTLRNDLAFYYTNADNKALSERPAYREHVRGVIPLEIQDYIWAKCFRSDVQFRQTLVDCPSPVGEAEAAAVNRRIADNAKLLEELRYWMSLQRVATIVVTSQRKVAEQLLARIDAKRF